MLSIIDNGLHIDEVLKYAWVQVSTPASQYYRVIALKQLAVIPILDKEAYDLLGKQWGAVRGLYNAGVNFMYAAAGIYDPEHIGIVQYYGAAADGPTKEDAAQRAMAHMGTVEGVLANFPQSKLDYPDQRWMEWYIDFITSRGKNIAALLGHPDPRQGKRGAQDGAMGNTDAEDLSAEQNEIFFRGLAKLRESFVFQVMAEHINKDSLAHTLVRVAEVASNVASRRRGSIGFGFNLGIPLMAAVTQSMGAGTAVGVSDGQSVAESKSHGWGNQHGVGESHVNSVSHTAGTTESWGETKSTSMTETESRSHTESQMSSSTSGQSSTVSSSVGGGESSGWNAGASVNLGDVPVVGGVANLLGVGDVRVSGGYNQSQSSMWSQGNAETTMSTSTSGHGTSDTVGSAESRGEGHSVSHSRGVFQSTSHGSAHGKSQNWSEGENWGEAVQQGRSISEIMSRSMQQGVAGGFSTGLLPGLSFTRSWQTEDDVADRVTEVLRQLEGLVNQASAEGGFMTNCWIFTENDRGASAAEALAPQAFHGPNVPTPVLTVRPRPEDEDLLRAHAFAAMPWRGPQDGDPFDGLLWTAYATLMHAGQVAALTAPGLFEEGVAATTMAPIPLGMAWYPQMPGDIILGHQYSPETAELTRAQVRLDFSNLMHEIFAGDTGFGKSVAAIRQVYEETLKYHVRSVVLDFGAGWRQLLNAPGLEGKVNIFQLWPDAVRPFRWNPLQIGRHIAPETQWRAFADVFGSIAQLGVKRQKQEMLDALRRIYLRAGVLIDDPEVRKDPQWGKVQHGEEADLINVPAGTFLGVLTSAQRQSLAVYRSSFVGLSDLYAEVQDKLKNVPPRDTMQSGVLEGILFRFNPLVQGSAATQFAPGPDCIPVEDLSRPWGITIIEGGLFLDDFSKAFLLAWTGWHLYMDMVSRRVHEVASDEPLLCITYEEANKIFRKSAGGGGEDGGGGTDVTGYAEAQFRDARKYKVRFKVIVQAPSEVAQGITASCSNIVVGFLKDPKDKDIILSALARSEKGFRDEEWRRFIDDMPIGMSIGRFSYTMHREYQRPILFRPLMLEVPEPTDQEIAERLGRIAL